MITAPCVFDVVSPIPAPPAAETASPKRNDEQPSVTIAGSRDFEIFVAKSCVAAR